MLSTVKSILGIRIPTPTFTEEDVISLSSHESKEEILEYPTPVSNSQTMMINKINKIESLLESVLEKMNERIKKYEEELNKKESIENDISLLEFLNNETSSLNQNLKEN